MKLPMIHDPELVKKICLGIQCDDCPFQDELKSPICQHAYMIGQMEPKGWGTYHLLMEPRNETTNDTSCNRSEVL